MHMARTHALLIEGTAAGVDKGSGLLHLLQVLNIPAQRVLAVGDNETMSMLKIAGMGVAMGQATDKVKAAARNGLRRPLFRRRGSGNGAVCELGEEQGIGDWGLGTGKRKSSFPVPDPSCRMQVLLLHRQHA